MGVLLFFVLLYSPHIVSFLRVFRNDDLEKYELYSLSETFFNMLVLIRVIIEPFLLTEKVSYEALEDMYGGSDTLP